MTAIVIANSIAAVLVVAGLAAAMRFGHLVGGGRFERELRRLEVHRGGGDSRLKRSELRRAA
jgi:hypothetical protein